MIQVKRINLILFFLIADSILISIFVGGRPIDFGTDTFTYLSLFEKTVYCECVFEKVEPLFGLLAYLISLFTESGSFYLSILAFIQGILAIASYYVLSSVVSVDRIRGGYIILSFSLLLMFPFFLGGQTNVIRQGISAYLIAMSGVYFLLGQKKQAVIFSILASGFHYSSIMYLAFFPLLMFELSSVFMVTALLTVLYFLGVVEFLIQAFSNITGLGIYEYVKNYGAVADYQAGIRIDFLAFSWLPIIIHYLYAVLVKQSGGAADKGLGLLIKFYMVLLMPFWLVGWASFSDRYAFSAWLLMPAIFGAACFKFISVNMAFSCALLFVANIYYLYRLGVF